MKILHVIYTQQVAGAEKYLLNLLPGLKEMGIDCELICVTTEKDKQNFSEFLTELRGKGITVTLITGGVKNFLSIARKISTYMRKNNIQNLHTHLFKADLLGVIVKKIFKPSLFLLSTKHGYDENYLNSNAVHSNRIIRNRYYYIARYLTRNIDANVTISDAMADLYFKLRLSKTKMPFIHHGVKPVKQGSESRRLSTPQLIIVGRLEEMKGHDYLFDALPAVIKEFPTVKLLILGEGTKKPGLEKKASTLQITGHISFLGFQKDPYSYVASSDVIVLPSLYEPFGLVYIEAFALKTPVVAFDVKASNEIIEQMNTGILVPLYDSAALAEKIIYLLSNPAERIRIADNAGQKFENHFNTSRMIQETAAWYKSVINSERL